MGRKRGRKKGRRREKRRLAYRGTQLWKLLSNLPNNGVGRLIIRGSFRWTQEEPCYMRVLEVNLDKKIAHRKTGKFKIPVKVEKIWRGVLQPRPVNIQSVSYLDDFILVPKNEEEKYMKHTKTPREKGYVYWNAQQRQNIRNMVAQGIPLAEAKQKEKERIWREEDEAAGTTRSQQQAMSSCPNSSVDIVYDNYDDCEDENGTDDSFDNNEPKKYSIEITHPKSVNEPDSRLERQQQNSTIAYMADKEYSLQQNSPRPSRSVDNFTAQQYKIVENRQDVTYQEPYSFHSRKYNLNYDNFTAEQYQKVGYLQNDDTIQEPTSFNGQRDNLNYDNFDEEKYQRVGYNQNAVRHQESPFFDDQRSNLNYNNFSAEHYHRVGYGQNDVTNQKPKSFDGQRNNFNYDNFAAEQYQRIGDNQSAVIYQELKYLYDQTDKLNYDQKDGNRQNSITAKQQQRIENMVRRGMPPETAVQMELERLIAFHRAREN
ncbi:uncharacterized protein [Eurosta solidaginis]|uniref:uncharacterized protein n=1 Tax=Eurosta solidaginis TaxID=178769 RepID=UPI0035306B38